MFAREADRWEAEVAAASLEAERKAAYGDEPQLDPTQELPVMSEPQAAPAEKAEEPVAGRILKCSDSAGSVTYTQGYCPPGTREVSR